MDSQGSKVLSRSWRKSGSPVSGGEADGFPASPDQVLGLIGVAVAGPGRAVDEAGDLLAGGSPQQLPDGRVQVLSQDVPKGDVDGGGGGGNDGSAFIVLSAVQLLVDVFDAARVLPDQKVAHVLDGPGHGLLAGGGASLSDAVDALVGFDFDDQQVFALDTHETGLDVGNLHACSFRVGAAEGLGVLTAPECSSAAWRAGAFIIGQERFQGKQGLEPPGPLPIDRAGWLRMLDGMPVTVRPGCTERS